MKNIILTFVIFVSIISNAQNKKLDLGEFEMSNSTSPAFLLIEETPTAIYIPDNLKALAIHVLDNFGESLSIEISPYFLLGTKNKNRTYYKYIGVEKDTKSNNLKQKPFSGLNTTTISFAYVDKEFKSLNSGKHKTYSIGVRTTILRFYDKEKIHNNALKIANILQDISVPIAILTISDEVVRNKAIKEHVLQQESIKKLELYQKPIKPLFRLDGAIGYSALFKEKTSNSGTVNRFGSWLTAEGSIILNEGSLSRTNNYLNVFLTARYIEDEFNIDSNQNYFVTKYRDFGGKIEFEFGKFALGYEYISRNGFITSERSIGNIKFTINKDISITGGFGKDFPVDDNLVTVFGINWGLNLGENKVSL